MASKGSKEAFIKVGLLVVLILLVILASPTAKEIFTTKSVNETTIKSLNVSNLTSNSEEKNTESVTTSEVSLIPQIINDLPTILGILVPLIIIWWFRKEIHQLFNRNVTSVEVPGFKVGLADYPEVSEIGQGDGLVWRGRVTETITMSLFGTANISEEEIKKLEARIETKLGEFSEIVIKGINEQQGKPSGAPLDVWKDYANQKKELGKNRLLLADIYNTINKKDIASHQVAEAELSLKTAKEALDRTGLSTIVPKDHSFTNFVLVLDTVHFTGVCKHLEAYISEGTFSAPLYGAIEQYKQVLMYINYFLENKEFSANGLVKAEDLIEKINQKNGLKNASMEDLTYYVANCCMYMGDAYLLLKNYEKAQENLNNVEKILSEEGKFKKKKLNRLELLLSLYITRGEMYYQQAYTDKADLEFENAIKILNDIRSITLKDVKKEYIYKPDYHYDISAYWWFIKNKYDNAKRLQANGLIKEAREAYEETINRFNDKRDEIERAFGEGSTFSFTGIAQIYYDLGLLCVNAHKLESAEENFENAIKILPEDPQLHIALGNVRFSKEDYKEAIKEYDHALRLEPGNPIALLNRAAAEQKLTKKEPEKVEEKSGKDKKESVKAKEDSGKEKIS